MVFQYFSGSDAGQEGPLVDHFDFGELISRTSCLEELHITYGLVSPYIVIHCSFFLLGRNQVLNKFNGTIRFWKKSSFKQV